MDKFLDKLENYNILNYILPAIIFISGFKYYIGIDINMGDNVISQFFILYFIGLVLSRIGSLIIKPILAKLNIANQKQGVSYAEFFKAESKDAKIKILFANYNMYRTFIAVFCLLLILKPLYVLKNYFNIESTICITIGIILLIILFICSYKKEFDHIQNRIKNTKE